MLGPCCRKPRLAASRFDPIPRLVARRRDGVSEEEVATRGGAHDPTRVLCFNRPWRAALLDLRELSLADIGRRLRTSYWFVPTLIVAAAIGLTLLSAELDERVARGAGERFDALWIMQPDGARAVLSSIAGAMITVVSVTFSMTMVSVSFAAGQIGPRLVRNFMRDRTNQITLGAFIAAFVYALVALRSVRDGSPVDAGGWTPASFRRSRS